MIKYPNLTMLILDDRIATTWPDELRRREFTVDVQKNIDGFFRGHIICSDAKVIVEDALGPDARHNNGPIAGRRVILVYTSHEADANTAGSNLELLGQVVSALETIGATRIPVGRSSSKTA